MTKNELEQWLGEHKARSVALGEIAEVLHIVMDASRRSLALTGPDELRELRFAVAVLRDVFPNDDDVRAWLTAPARDLNGAAPADLLSAGRVREFVDLTVAEWNRPRGFRVALPRAMFVRARGLPR